MAIGDLVKAVWGDGLVLIGRFYGKKQGYIILVDETNTQVPCDPNCVTFEVLKFLPNHYKKTS